MRGRAGRACGVTDNGAVNDELNRIPPSRRRRMAAVLAPLGVVLLVAGVLAISLHGVLWTLVGCCVAVLAVVLLAMAWGLLRSAALSDSALAEKQLDAAILAASGSAGSDCGPAGVRGAADGCGASDVCGLAGSADGCGSCLSRQTLTRTPPEPASN
jgi:hypothetical protein